MSLFLSICYWTSFALLVLTKAADVATTWRHVAAKGETNPFARALFARFGIRIGLGVVSAMFLVLASGQYWLVWELQSEPLSWANTALGLCIACLQFDVARANATGRQSMVTRAVASLHRRWDEALRRRGGGG